MTKKLKNLVEFVDIEASFYDSIHTLQRIRNFLC